MNSNIAILVYTHSEYSFLWNIMISLLDKYVDKTIQIIWLTDDNTGDNLKRMIPGSWMYFTYSDSMIWTKRVGNCLNQLSYEYILFLHEDWLPIGNIKEDILNSMIKFMKEYECNYLLAYSHISTTSRQSGIFSGYKDYYYYKENNHVFQPAIWNKYVFEEFCYKLNKTKHQNEDRDCLNFMSNRNCYSIQNIETVTRLRTTNSIFFPHMHALSEGLWNFKRYPSLKSFLESYGIDTSTRGTHSWWELDTQ